METKKFTEVEQAGACSLTAVLATLNVPDSDNDILLAGSFGEQVVPFIWGHRQEEIPLGKARVREVGDQVVAEVEIIDKATCDWLRLDFSDGSPRQQYSWGFLVPEGGAERRDDGVRLISAVDMLEVSGVLRAASIGTRTLGVKSCRCGGTCSTAKAHLPGEAFLEELQLKEEGKIRAVRQAAPEWLQGAVNDVAHEFDIQTRPVVVFRRATIAEKSDLEVPDALGSVRPNVDYSPIFVQGGRSDFELLQTALHELAHVAGLGSGSGDELAADEFGYQQATKYIDPEVGNFAELKGIRLIDGSLVPMMHPGGEGEEAEGW